MTAAAPAAHVELAVTGMTCSSCAARIEKKLNRLAGVTAEVNYATERATVDYDPSLLDPAQLVEAVEATGYGARELPVPGAAAAVGDTVVDDPAEREAEAHLA
jgi:Cu+-exporting ATPase